ncbi:MAG: hypothetical protein ACOC41_04110 [Chitinivibrionales bacterium]
MKNKDNFIRFAVMFLLLFSSSYSFDAGFGYLYSHSISSTGLTIDISDIWKGFGISTDFPLSFRSNSWPLSVWDDIPQSFKHIESLGYLEDNEKFVGPTEDEEAFQSAGINLNYTVKFLRIFAGYLYAKSYKRYTVTHYLNGSEDWSESVWVRDDGQHGIRIGLMGVIPILENWKLSPGLGFSSVEKSMEGRIIIQYCFDRNYRSSHK